MEPWLADALNRRSLGYATPAAPTELLALALAFAIAAAGLFFLLAKVAFQNAWRIPFADWERERPAGQTAPVAPVAAIELTAHARALSVSEGVMNLVRHEEGRMGAPRQLALQGAPQASTGSPAGGAMATPIGSSWRRTSQRTTAAQTNRDNRR
jgi:type IV secretion system protein VirB6